MDCTTFFERVEAALGDVLVRPRQTTSGGQCVVDFFHPATAARLGDDSLVTAFNRSGIVWAPPARRLAVQLRVPEAHDDAVRAALETGPFPVERTDHRGASAPDGEMVMLLHYSVGGSDVDDDTLDATLAAVERALAVGGSGRENT